MTVDLTETQDGQIFITTEDGQGETRIILLLRAPFKLKLLSYPSTGYPVSVSNVISVPVSMYQSVMANMQTIQTNSDGTVCLAPMQVDTTATRGSAASSTSPSSVATAGLAGGVQCYSLISAGTAVLSRRSQQAAPGGVTTWQQPPPPAAAPPAAMPTVAVLTIITAPSRTIIITIIALRCRCP